MIKCAVQFKTACSTSLLQNKISLYQGPFLNVKLVSIKLTSKSSGPLRAVFSFVLNNICIILIIFNTNFNKIVSTYLCIELISPDPLECNVQNIKKTCIRPSLSSNHRDHKITIFSSVNQFFC